METVKSQIQRRRNRFMGPDPSVDASGNVAAARQIQIGQVPATANVNLNASLRASGDLLFVAPTYTFATPVLGGQLAAADWRCRSP